jgi:hypothetical protein
MGIIKYILKEYRQESDNILYLTKDDVLFHGTGEDFLSDELTVGGYDKVLWTSTSSLVAQTYIPNSAGTYMLSTQTLSQAPRTQNDQSTLELQRQLGIDYNDVQYDSYGRRSSHTTPKIFTTTFKKEYDFNQSIRQKIRDGGRNLSREELNELYDQLINTELLHNEFVNDKLQNEYGYKPFSKDSYNENYHWKINVQGNTIIKADEQLSGRLFVLKPKEDLKLFDMSLAESREPDLTDVDYHNINIFRKLEDGGFDGVKITDFAQVEKHGNVGHYSYGIFKNSISKLKIYTIIKAYHPKDFGERSWEMRTQHSKEYEQYLKNSIS